MTITETKNRFFTKTGNRKQSTIGRAFLLNVLNTDADALDFSSKELFAIYGAQYAKKSGYALDVAKKRFYSSLSAVKRIVEVEAEA